ncbi:hypothetical protein cand_015840 [Cryptosporidium andersoni]|uniref:Uncharacterized protein n=1 Tax=Cryptosporidium andersoni TaxID=117008 RepID=A0A1J4MTJ2_9CRYT|nr:hypothetical protein cand_015840 [Cryptosporidium andersoni]
MTSFWIWFLNFLWLSFISCNIPLANHVTISSHDYKYMSRIGNVKPLQLDIFGSYRRTEYPIYTIIFLHGYTTPYYVYLYLTRRFFIKLTRHLDHYDQRFSDNVHLISPDWLSPIDKELSNLTIHEVLSFRGGRPRRDVYLTIIVSIIAFINSLYRKGVITSMDKTAIYGNCVGGVIGGAAALGVKYPLGAVVLNSSGIFHLELIYRVILRTQNLKAHFLLINGDRDSLIDYKLAEATEEVLRVWGAKDVTFIKLRTDHLETMSKYIYTGFRFIASVLLSRPEIFRPDDSDDTKLVLMTIKKVPDRKSIVPIVPITNKTTDVTEGIQVYSKSLSSTPLNSTDLNITGIPRTWENLINTTFKFSDSIESPE